jgi:hypothetical protein
MVLDVENAAYLAEAAGNEDEWIRRFRKQYKSQVWLTEHDVEAEFAKTLAAETLWLKEIDGIRS